MSSFEKIARILRTDKDFLAKAENRFMALTGRRGILDKIAEENETVICDRLARLGLTRDVGAEEVYDALISKIEADELKMFEALGRPSCAERADCDRSIELVRKVHPPARGLFLKKEKAFEFLRREPPGRVMSYLGYASVDELLAKENLLEVMSALRFVEGSDWLNSVFFKQYERLTPDDFEEREIQICVLDKKWIGAAEKFLRKKWHNISHLKELGVVFVIPASLGISGEIIRMLSLVFHYLNEVKFYADVIRSIAQTPATFSTNLLSLLRGDVEERRLSEGGRSLWLVVQRYLAKDDENDWRLFVPRINPEALHWIRAEEDMIKLGNSIDSIGSDLSFWLDLGWVGDFFKDDIGNDVLVSFDLVDAVMSLVKRKELIKYLYHHQEALWNKIFIEYMGRDQLEKFSKDYLLQGYFEI